jgi:gliding motility-associated-like protein
MRILGVFFLFFVLICSTSLGHVFQDGLFMSNKSLENTLNYPVRPIKKTDISGFEAKINDDTIIIDATGNDVYCPLSQQTIVTDFTITNPSSIPIDALYVQISEGFEFGEDFLTLIGSNPGISATWNSGEAKLTITSNSGGPISESLLIAAVKNVAFESSSSTVSGTKQFSITIGDANYLPETGHYYEFVSQVGISWHEAKTAAEARTYYGLNGYLATITSQVEAQFAGKQSQGTGWIGGSDETTEGVWKWETGPEAGDIFWNGGPNGSSPPGAFAFWNNDEPNNLGNEDYAHITAPNVGIQGSWNDLPASGTTGDYEPKGYIVEYGWPGDTPLNISTSTQLRVAEITEVIENFNCGPGQVLLSATPSEGDVLWFNNPTGGLPVYTGPSYLTPNLSATTDFYVAASVNGCSTGDRTKVMATIRTIPSITSVNNNVRCGLGSVNLSATASQGTINWYDQPTGGQSLGFGTQFDTPEISTTTIYYVDATVNGCITTTRTPVTATVNHTSAPVATSPQLFCSDENPEVLNLTITGSNIKWYEQETGGTALASSQLLTTNTSYWASQTLNNCESFERTEVQVTIYQSANPLSAGMIANLEVCDDGTDGNTANGISYSDLTTNATEIMNGQSPSDFVLSYFSDTGYTNPISDPINYLNTAAFQQTIFVRMTNLLEPSCYSDTSFVLEIHELPQILFNTTLKNCDEDGVPDGFTDYNLSEANGILSNGIPNLTFSYYQNLADAHNKINAIPAAPYNNISGNIVFARVENEYGCYQIATIFLDVSTTSFSPNYSYLLETCEQDDTNDGLHRFDLTLASKEFMDQFPTGQQLSVHYYRNLSDAQLELNEITDQENYMSEQPDLQTLFVRVESLVNGDCFGIGPHLELKVNHRPEVIVPDEAIWCSNLLPIVLHVENPDLNVSYSWFDEQGNLISSEASASIANSGEYTVTGTSILGCVSFPQTIEVKESVIATISQNDITVIENSINNSITIHNELNQLGVGDYEFALDDPNGPYRQEPYFDNLLSGVYTLYIRDKNNCGTAQLDVPILGFPKFFTPNNDGHNDYWQIRGLGPEYMVKTTIHIFDRFGKSVAVFNGTDVGWDGLFNGELLPATDYWYAITMIHDQNGMERVVRGHFSLIRR